MLKTTADLVKRYIPNLVGQLTTLQYVDYGWILKAAVEDGEWFRAPRRSSCCETVVEQFQTTRAEYVMVKAQSLRVSDENPNV